MSSDPESIMVPNRMGHMKKLIGGMMTISRAFLRSLSGPGGVPLYASTNSWYILKHVYALPRNQPMLTQGTLIIFCGVNNTSMTRNPM